MKVAALRSKLKELGLPVSGNKATLQARLDEALGTSESEPNDQQAANDCDSSTLSQTNSADSDIPYTPGGEFVEFKQHVQSEIDFLRRAIDNLCGTGNLVFGSVTTLEMLSELDCLRRQVREKDEVIRKITCEKDGLLLLLAAKPSPPPPPPPESPPEPSLPIWHNVPAARRRPGQPRNSWDPSTIVHPNKFSALEDSPTDTTAPAQPASRSATTQPDMQNVPSQPNAQQRNDSGASSSAPTVSSPSTLPTLGAPPGSPPTTPPKSGSSPSTRPKSRSPPRSPISNTPLPLVDTPIPCNLATPGAVPPRLPPLPRNAPLRQRARDEINGAQSQRNVPQPASENAPAGRDQELPRLTVVNPYPPENEHWMKGRVEIPVRPGRKSYSKAHVRKILLETDSIAGGIKRDDLQNECVKLGMNVDFEFRRQSGGQSHEMHHHSRVFVADERPHGLIIIGGTNDLPKRGGRRQLDDGEIANNLLAIGQQAKELGVVNVYISGITIRRGAYYQNRIRIINRLLREGCKKYGFDFIDNSNILGHHTDGLHLTNEGSSILMNNIINCLY